MVAGLPKFAGSAARQRASSPKLQVLNTGLMSALSGQGFEQAREDRPFWGRLVESAVGAHIFNSALSSRIEVFYWREGQHEVDFVLRRGGRVIAIEVKIGRRRDAMPGMEAFARLFEPARKLLVGGDGIPLREFLLAPLDHWMT